MLDTRTIDEEMEAEREMQLRRHDLENDPEFHRRVRRGNDDLDAGRTVAWADLCRKYHR